MTEKKTPENPDASDATSEDSTSRGRRRALRRLLVGSGVVAGSKIIPEKWSQPVIDSVVLPTHAAGSPPESPVSSKDS